MGKNLTKQQQQIILLLFLFIGGGGYGYWNYLLKPTLEKISQQEKQYEDLVQKIQRAERQARRLPALKNELEKLQAELVTLEKQLPKDKDIPNIIRTITREAIRENLEFTRVDPKKPVTRQYFEILPFGISFNGSLHALVRFLASLGQQERIFKAGNISLSPSGKELTGENVLNIKLDLETYAYKG